MRRAVVVATIAGSLILGGLWAWRNEGWRSSPAVQTPALALFYNAEEQSSEKSLVSQVVQSQLRAKGITATLEPVPSAVFNDRLGKGEFQVALSLWYLDYDDAEGFLTDFYSKSGFRMSKYQSAAFDAAYEAGLFAPAVAEKAKAYRGALDLLAGDLPWIPLFSNDELFLIRKAASGFSSNAYQYYDYRRARLSHVRTASDVEVQTLDPALAYDLASKHIVTQSYEGLIALDGANQIVPALATQWRWEDNNKSLVFTLRPGVVFHAASTLSSRVGTLEAADVKASFERLLTANSPYSYIFDHVVGAQDFKTNKATQVAGFVAEGPRTFRIQLTRAFPTMLPWLLAPAASVLPRHLPKDYDFARGSVGTGPFVLRSWNGATAEFDAHNEYWLVENGARLPVPKRLTIQILREPNAALLAFRSGELDILNVPLALYDAVLAPDGTARAEWRDHEFREVRLNNLKFLAFNMAASPWGTDVALRRRVAEALDRDAIVATLFRGHARAAASLVPSGVSGLTER